MPLPAVLAGRLAAPVLAAPMFLVSGPDLVVEACRGGVVGCFPSLNNRTSDGYAGWLEDIEARLAAAGAAGERPAPFAVNLIVHRTNPRLDADLAVTIAHEVPLVLTSMGAVGEVVDAVHGYGGVVFHDVATMRHVEKAIAAGVDGIIAVTAGAGGHTGSINPFAFVGEIRRLFAGTIILSGAISTGAQVAAARLMGADLACIGTRYIATRESLAPPAYKAMLLQASVTDIMATSKFTGVTASFLKPSIVAAGLDPEDLAARNRLVLDPEEARAWKAIWSAGQGVGAVTDLPGAAELGRRIAADYRAALAGAPALAGT